MSASIEPSLLATLLAEPAVPAERELIAGLLVDATIPPEHDHLQPCLEILSPEDILDAPSRKVYEAMEACALRGEPHTMQTIAHELRAKGLTKPYDLLTQLAELATTGAHCKFNAATALRASKTRTFKARLQETLEDPEPDEAMLLSLESASSAVRSTANTNSELSFRLASDIEPKAIEWLWEPYLLRNKLNLISGDGNVGKTFLALNICTALSNGWGLPGQDGRPQPSFDPVTVAYANGEDDPADTLIPRLRAMNASLQRVHIIDEIKLGPKRRQWTMQDLLAIERYLAANRPTVLFVDPIQAYLGPDIDMNSTGDVRPVLGGFAALAEKYQCATVIICHHNKATVGRAIHKIGGSADFSQRARSCLMVGRDKQDTDLRILAQSKMNLAKQGVALSYRIQGKPAALEWCGPVETTPDDLAAPDAPKKDQGALESAKDAIRAALANGPRQSIEVERELKDEAGISRMTYWRARAELGIPKGRTISLPQTAMGGRVTYEAV